MACAAVCWSSGGLIVRLVSTTPWTTSLWRSVFAALFLSALLSIVRRRNIVAQWREGGRPVVLVASCMAAASTCFIFSLAYTSVANTLILMSTGPYVAGLLGWLWLGERVPLRNWLTMSVALTGTIVMVSSGMGELSGLGPSVRARLTDPALTREGVAEAMRAFVDDVAGGRHRERGWPSSAYSVSKAGLNALVRVWAPELGARGIIINAVCPGWVRTRMGGSGASRSVERGGASIVWAALREHEPTGGFFRDGRRIDW